MEDAAQRVIKNTESLFRNELSFIVNEKNKYSYNDNDIHNFVSTNYYASRVKEKYSEGCDPRAIIKNEQLNRMISLEERIITNMLYLKDHIEELTKTGSVTVSSDDDELYNTDVFISNVEMLYTVIDDITSTNVPTNVKNNLKKSVQYFTDFFKTYSFKVKSK